MKLVIKEIQKRGGDFVGIEVEDTDNQTNLSMLMLPKLDVDGKEVLDETGHIVLELQPDPAVVPEYASYHYDINPEKETAPGTFAPKTKTEIKAEIKSIIKARIELEKANKLKQEAFYTKMVDVIGTTL